MTAYWYGRLSTNKQEDGGGAERQRKLAKVWCERRRIPLDETLSYFDTASGYHGTHLKKKDGGLRLFLKACEDDKVKAGSYLLVESLDRLSREQLQEGQKLIHRLLFDHGIRIVTLLSEVEYNAENYEQTHWAIDAEFARAHSESYHKSLRSKHNWETRRKNLTAGGVLTRKIPTWLKIVGGKPDRDDAKTPVVRRVFEMAARGHGFASIALKLNAEKVKPFGKGRFWRDSVVEKILKSRAVLGEYQPMRFETVKEGKQKKRVRVPAGPVVEGYFPRIITADQWLAAHRAIASRKLARGRISPKVSNLFTHLVFDESGEAMAYTSKNYRGYLQTGKKDTPGVRYDHFERILLYWLREVKLRLGNTADVSDMQARAGKLAEAIKTLDSKIAEHPNELGYLCDQVARDRRDHAALLKEIEAATVPLQTHFLQSKRLVEALAEAEGEEREELRREVRQAIRLVVDRISVQVLGDKYGGKRMNVMVRFKDGTHRGLFYNTKAGRVVEGGLLLWTLEFADGRTDETDKYNSLLALTKNLAEFGQFPLDPDPQEEIKAKCKEMRAAKKSYKEIEAKTGLHRTTIYRYLNDYDRIDREAERATPRKRKGDRSRESLPTKPRQHRTARRRSRRRT